MRRAHAISARYICVINWTRSSCLSSTSCLVVTRKLCRMKTEGDIAAIRHNLGNRIKFLREGQDLSQYTFSRMVSLDRTYLIGVEKGRRNVSIDNLCKISRGLGISLSELCEGTDDRKAINERLELMRQMMEEAEQAEADESGAEEA